MAKKWSMIVTQWLTILELLFPQLTTQPIARMKSKVNGSNSTTILPNKLTMIKSKMRLWLKMLTLFSTKKEVSMKTFQFQTLIKLLSIMIPLLKSQMLPMLPKVKMKKWKTKKRNDLTNNQASLQPPMDIFEQAWILK